MAGEYPCSWDEEESRQKIRWLLANGVTFILDLTEEDEYGLKPYASLFSEEALASNEEGIYIRQPIPDMSTPSIEEMHSILERLDSALRAGHTTYVHCYGGIGRTGTVIGCYLVKHGLTGEAALVQIARLREGTPDGWKESPETPNQRQFVLNWKE